MASLFPSPATTGQITKINGVTYIYDTTKGWLKTSNILDNTIIMNGADNTKQLSVDISGNTTGIKGTLITKFSTAKTINFPDLSGTLAIAENTVSLSANGNITLTPNTLYDVISISVANSVLTLPSGTKTGDRIDILVSCTGYNSATTFIITGSVNSNATEQVINDKSFVLYSFIWSGSMSTWVFSISR